MSKNEIEETEFKSLSLNKNNNTESFMAMHLQLLNIAEISVRSMQKSDFEMFLKYSKLFLSQTSEHEKYIDALKKSYNSIKNKNTKSLHYYLASYMKQSTPIFEAVQIIKDIKIKSNWAGILGYINSFKINDTSITNYIQSNIIRNKGFVSKTLFEYVYLNKEKIKDFMFLEDDEYIYRQIDFIANSKVMYNLSYYIQFLGSESKLLCTKVFEAFNFLLQEIETNVVYYLNNIPDELEILSVSNHTQAFLKHRKYKIINENNFYFYGYALFSMPESFFSTKPGLSDHLKRFKIDVVEEIFEDYFDFRYLSNESRHSHECDCYEC